MKLVIPGVLPSVNHMYKNVFQGKRHMKVLTREAEDWKNEIIIRTNAWKNKSKWNKAKGKVIVRLWYFFPDHRKRDTHNTLKLLLDCFEDAEIYSNDLYALPQIMDFDIDAKFPRVEVEFELLEGDSNGLISSRIESLHG